MSVGRERQDSRACLCLDCSFWGYPEWTALTYCIRQWYDILCLGSSYNSTVWIISPAGIDMIFIYSVSLASSWGRLNIFTKPHCSVATSPQTLSEICFLLVPLFLSSVCTPLRGVHVTQFLFSSFPTESRETVQSRSTQRNFSSTVSPFAEMTLLPCYITFHNQYSHISTWHHLKVPTR